MALHKKLRMIWYFLLTATLIGCADAGYYEKLTIQQLREQNGSPDKHNKKDISEGAEILEFRDHSANDVMPSRIGHSGFKSNEDTVRERRRIQGHLNYAAASLKNKFKVLDNNSSDLTVSALMANCGGFFDDGEYIGKFCKKNSEENKVSYLKKTFGADLLIEICESIKTDPAQVPKAYYHKIFKEFWGVNQDDQITSVGIASDFWAIPVTEDSPQVCESSEKSQKLRAAQKNARNEEIRQRTIEIEKQKAVKAQMEAELVKSTFGIRRSPWSSFEHYASTGGGLEQKNYFYDKKSVEKSGVFRKVLTTKEFGARDAAFATVEIFELNCRDESYRALGEVLVYIPLQKQQVWQVALPESNEWFYIIRNTTVHRLWEELCL
jgi:hypothetical protein